MDTPSQVRSDMIDYVSNPECSMAMKSAWNAGQVAESDDKDWITMLRSRKRNLCSITPGRG